MESAIAERLKSQSELSDLHTLLAEKSARLTALEASGDLANASVLAEISRLQTLTALLPRRIAAKQEDDAKAEQALIQATNQFIREHLGPRIRQLIACTKAVVEREMSPHFPDPAALILAVAGSECLRRVQALDWSVSLTPAQGAIKHAEAALNSWTSADEFEKRFTPNKPNE